MQKPLSIIVATEQRGGIGIDSHLPWKISKDILFFRNKTIHTSSPEKINAVIMGRKTWNSLPHAPLRERLNIVISPTLVSKRIAEANLVDDNRIFQNKTEKNIDVDDSPLHKSTSSICIEEDVTQIPIFFSTLEDAVKYCDECLAVESMFVIGGGQLYSYCMEHMLERLDTVYWTLVKRVVKGCDCFFEPPAEFFRDFRITRLEEEVEGEYTIVRYEKKEKW